MNRTTLNARLPRTLRDASRDAFDWLEHCPVPPADRLLRLWRPLSWVLLFGLFAFLGVLLAWRG